MRTLLASLALLIAIAAHAEDTTSGLAIATTSEPLGDTDAGVVSRLTFRFGTPDEAAEVLVLQGSILRDGVVLRNFRYELMPRDRSGVVTTVQTLPEGTVDVEVRLLAPSDESAPIILGKSTTKVTVAKTNKLYVANESDSGEAIFAEGVVPESVGAVKIRAPRRDVAPNLFIVDVEVLPPVTRVEFFVDGKKILARNSVPYRAELDLGKLPKRVEVRAVGYDIRGRYVDADAFLVNEREAPLEVKITRVTTPDGVAHFKLSVQNPKNNALRVVALYAGDKKLHEWTRPPYALDIPMARLTGVDYVRATVIDSTGYEAGDLIFLSGDRHIETMEVNLVQLPVSVSDAAGAPIAELKEENFTILEDGKPKKISNFNYAANLPVSVGVLLDRSGSMKPRWEPAKDAAGAFFRRILKGPDRAFITGFAMDATHAAPFASDPAALEEQIALLGEAEGGTSLYDAMITGLYRFRTIQGRKALIIISDGDDTTSRLSYDDMLGYARAARVPLYFIGIALGITDIGGTSKMKALAAETGGIAYFIKDVKKLDETYTQLEKDLRSQYLISYHTESSKKDQSYRTVEVKVDRPDAKIRTIRGFIP